jgi:prepilin-type N-terminal cleavage/methylation domain-containing protein
MNNEHLKCGLRPPAQAPPHRGFCPGGRARWLGEMAGCGMKTPNFKGMTLIEVIAAIIIIGILAATVLPRIDFGGTSSTASAGGAAYMIASDIRYTQECAMASLVSKSISFTNGQSVYTFPATTPSTSSLDPSGRLPSGATTGTTITFIFNSLGEPTTGGGSSVTVSAGGITKTITVTQYTGKVNIS